MILLAGHAFPQGAVSNDLTKLYYATLQAAIDAGTNNYSVYLVADLTNAPVSVNSKTNLYIGTSPAYGGAGTKAHLFGNAAAAVGMDITNCGPVTVDSIRFSAWAGVAALRQQSSSGSFSNLEFVSNLQHGLCLTNANFNLVTGCYAATNLYNGIVVFSGRSNTVQFCTVISNSNGIESRNGLSNRLFSNIALECHPIGIKVDSSDSNDVSSNYVAGCGWNATYWSGGGIYINNSYSARVYRNLVESNHVGIQLGGSPRNATVTENWARFNTNIGFHLNASGASNILVASNTAYATALASGLGFFFYTGGPYFVYSNMSYSNQWMGMRFHAQKSGTMAWENCAFSNGVFGNGSGFYISDSTNISLYSNQAHTNGQYGIYRGGTVANSNLFYGNQIHGGKWQQYGIFLGGGITNFGDRVVNNMVSNHFYDGIRIDAITNGYILSNRSHLNGQWGLRANGSSNLVVADNEVRWCASNHGFVIYNGAFGNLVQNNIASECGAAGFYFKGESNWVIGNMSRFNTNGYLSYAYTNNAAGKGNGSFFLSNQAHSNAQTGMRIEGLTNGLILGNACSSNFSYGLVLYRGFSNVVRENNLFMGVAQQQGLRVESWSGSNVYVSNRVTGHLWNTSSFGISLESAYATNEMLMNNIVISNYKGISIAYNGSNVMFYGNEIGFSSNNGLMLYSTGANAGPQYSFVCSNTIYGTPFTSGAAGIVAQGPSCIGNLFLSNRLYSNYQGTRGNQCLSNVWLNNFVHDSPRGMVPVSESNGLYASNNVSNCFDMGIYAANVCVSNEYRENTVDGAWVGTNGFNINANGTGVRRFERYLKNTVRRTTGQGMYLSVISDVELRSNWLSNNAIAMRVALSTNLTIAANTFTSNARALWFETGNMSNAALSNAFGSNALAVVMRHSTNTLVQYNSFGGSTILAVSNEAGQSNIVTLNNLSNNALSLYGDSGLLECRTNYFGSRSFSNFALVGAPAITPWLTRPAGKNGDFLPPDAPLTLTSSNGTPGNLVLTWSPQSAAGDFGAYAVYRSTNALLGWSNLVDAEFLAQVAAVGTTNYVDAPPVGYNWNYYVAVRDANSNECAYSPGISVPWFAASATATPGNLTTNAPFTAALAVNTGTGWWSTNGGANWYSYPTAGTNVIISNARTLLAYAVDGAVSATNTYTYAWDSVAPTAGFSPGSLTTNVAFTVSLTTTENNGFYSTNGGASWVAYTTAGTNLVISNGVVLRVFARDGAGNTSATNTATYVLDLTPPVIGVSPLPGLTNAPFTVTLTANENSGYWSTNGGANWYSFPTTGTNFIISNSLTLLTYGRDILSNYSATNSSTWTFDNGAPVVGVSPAGCLTNVAFSAALSTTKDYAYWSTNDGANWWQFGTGGTNVLVSANTSLLYYGRDGAGNNSATNRADYTFLATLTRFTAKADARKGLLVLQCETDRGVNDRYGLAFSLRPAAGGAWTPVPDGALLASATNFQETSTTNRLLVSNLAASNLVDLRAVTTGGGMEGGELVLRAFDLSVFGGMQDDLSKACALNNPYRGEAAGIQLLNLSADSKVTVHALSGRLVVELPPVSSRGAVSWNARDKAGNPVPAGTYLLRVVSAKGEKVLPVMVMP
ncbi:MAG: right-handed parallel beta-helix repeat-containing protein [Spirochaetes bacterium]|nr:right-handed parallel beta-helix repeat-containing protein [Spirochaetota bacterium]